MSPRLVSSYYVAILFATVLFQLEGLRWLVTVLHSWLANTLQTLTTFPIQGWIYWLVLLIAAFIIVTILKIFIIDPLELHANDADSRGWQVYFFAFIVLGLFIYILNLNFSQPMPSEIPGFIIKMLEGSRNTPGAEISSSAEGNFYSIFPWIWQLGPIIFMYYYANEAKKAS
jgi:hypothetical protein